MDGEVVKQEARVKNKTGRRKKRRISIRIDMTPMVDIAFLLLIFYMVSTIFSMPQAMEINLPPDTEEPPPEIRYSRLLTLRIDAQNRLFWNNWDPRDSLPKMLPAQTISDRGSDAFDTDSLWGLIKNINHRACTLSTLVIINDSARYNSMVDILDEIDRFERYRNMQLAAQYGVLIEDIPDSLKFSYRYAVGDWTFTDDNIIDDILTPEVKEN